jgi:hypothetical protein
MTPGLALLPVWAAVALEVAGLLAGVWVITRIFRWLPPEEDAQLVDRSGRPIYDASPRAAR